MRAIIGPNGAGKTTMMDIITGKTRPDSGTVLFEGDIDLTRHDESAIALLRDWPQVPETDGLRKPHGRGQSGTGAETRSRHLRHAVHRHVPGARRNASTRSWRRSASGHRRSEIAADLSHGQKQWLEIGMLLAQDPKLLLVDEPVAGMTDAETIETAIAAARNRRRKGGDRRRTRHDLHSRSRTSR